MSAARLITLRVQLLKDDITEFNDALSEPARELCRTYELRDDLPFEGRLFIAEPSDKPPPWFEFTNDGLADPLEHLRNKNNAAALIIRELTPV